MNKIHKVSGHIFPNTSVFQSPSYLGSKLCVFPLPRLTQNWPRSRLNVVYGSTPPPWWRHHRCHRLLDDHFWLFRVLIISNILAPLFYYQVGILFSSYVFLYIFKNVWIISKLQVDVITYCPFCDINFDLLWLCKRFRPYDIARLQHQAITIKHGNASRLSKSNATKDQIYRPPPSLSLSLPFKYDICISNQTGE